MVVLANATLSFRTIEAVFVIAFREEESSPN